MRFRYLRHPLFLSATGLYVVNRWWCRDHFELGTFLHSHLNDVLCIPIWVPVIVTLLRVLGLRDHNGAPDAGEILVPLLVWSLTFEVLLPEASSFRGVTFADPLDVVAYATGGWIGAMIWRVTYAKSTPARARPSSAVIAGEASGRSSSPTQAIARAHSAPSVRGMSQ